MALTHGPMRPGDVRECAEIVAKHPLIGPRYGGGIADLRAAWLRLLDCDAKTTTVLKADDGHRAPVCFVGVSVIVSDDFLHEIKTAPLVWVGPELVKRILRGNSPLLTDKQLREHNSRGGLNLLVWEGCIAPSFANDSEVMRRLMDLFVEEHRGFFWKEVIGSQADSVEQLQFTLKTGGLLWNPRTGRYVQSLDKDPSEIVRKPHLYGVTRELELERGNWGSWIGNLFAYHPPKCGFSRGEQRMLSKALEGWTDEELSERLAKSLPTIKKMWRSAYARVGAQLPELSLNDEEAEAIETKRGREKKRRLLAYLRNHPEELRPFTAGTGNPSFEAGARGQAHSR